jgi:DNA repair protein RecN (Recombination protein N)
VARVASAVRLLRLEIEDFALIARASLEFAAGFTVCSGETGSGKTMLLWALAFVLGERSSGDVVRSGATRARVTLEVQGDAAFQAALANAGLDGEPSEATLFVREMSAAGKSTARVNGRLATAAQLREAAEFLVELVGQHEQQRLLSRGYQTDLLDAFAGDDALRRRMAVANAYERVRVAERELAQASDHLERAAADLEFARFALAEIDDVAPSTGEDEALRERRDYLVNVERIRAALGNAHDALAGGDGSAIEATGTAATSLTSIARFASPFEGLASTLAGLQSELSEAAAAIARELEGSEFDAEDLEAVTSRLDRIERVKKKYGGSVAAVLGARARFEETIALETTRDEREAALQADLAGSRDALRAEASALSALRAAAARALETLARAELTGLAMPSARFGVVLEPLGEIGPGGGESVDFVLSANAGEPLRPLARAVSGGELSRVLLALVVVLADKRDGSALVFDEIDAGIGGATATAVGLRLGALARGAQVLCVTHLAQIASWADRHYLLRKRERSGATVVELVELEERRDVLEEIARMLSGSTAAVALQHAETLVGEVGRRKARTKLPA